MAAKCDEIADAVVTLLNAGSYSQSITAVKAYCPKFDQEAGELTTRRVTVSPAGEDKTRLTRGGIWQVDYAIHVQVWYQLEQVNNSTVAAEVLLVQELSDRLGQNALSGRQEQLEGCTTMTHDIQALTSDGVFIGAITAVYRGTR